MNTPSSKNSNKQQKNNLFQKYRLNKKVLKKQTDPNSLPKTTKDANTFDIEFGQSRAIKAIKTAIGIKASGYHIFAAGENGVGKRTIITRLLKKYALDLPTPDDCVYVYNFDDPREPIAITLPAGQGKSLAKDMNELWSKIYSQLQQRFAGDWYHTQLEIIKNEVHAKEALSYEELNEQCQKFQLELQFRSTDNKAVFVKPEQTTITDKANIDDNAAAGQANKQTTETDNVLANVLLYRENYSDKNHLNKQLNLLTIELEKLEDEANQAILDLNKSVAERIVNKLFEPLENKYQNTPVVINYLTNIKKDMITNVACIVNKDDGFVSNSLSVIPSRYCVNVMVSHEPNSGAPVIFEDLPTHLNLLGHVEQITEQGTITSDVSMIRTGSLHQANGGFLILEANRLTEHAYAWQGLKRALQSKKIRISSLEQLLTLTGSLSLAPMPIDLDVKVILLGEADLYYELIEFEPEFDAVFKVRADFHNEVARTQENEQSIVAKIADIVNKKSLLPFDNSALAAILDQISLLSDNQSRLSLHADRLSQLLYESNRHAQLDAATTVTNKHVELTIKDMKERSGYLRDLYWQEIKSGQQIINTRGYEIGQINALTVISYADSEFGMPARLTALIQPSMGSGDILDIERDVDLAGSLHAKGMLIMTSYLRALFSKFHNLNFNASLAFEQNYAHIDGDSATLAEACALLSALSKVPINQSIAITGSMNQLGEVQAVGGINAKISGYFDTCIEQGLTGQQGVIMPKANMTNLMLRDDIIQAVADKQFNIYTVDHLHEALHILTDTAVDELTQKGHYKKNTIFGKIVKQLEEWDDEDDEE